MQRLHLARVMCLHFLHNLSELLSYEVAVELIQPSVQMQKVGMECLDRMPFLPPALRPSIFAHDGSSGRNLR